MAEIWSVCLLDNCRLESKLAQICPNYVACRPYAAVVTIEASYYSVPLVRLLTCGMLLSWVFSRQSSDRKKWIVFWQVVGHYPRILCLVCRGDSPVIAKYVSNVSWRYSWCGICSSQVTVLASDYNSNLLAWPGLREWIKNTYCNKFELATWWKQMLLALMLEFCSKSGAVLTAPDCIVYVHWHIGPKYNAWVRLTFGALVDYEQGLSRGPNV